MRRSTEDQALLDRKPWGTALPCDDEDSAENLACAPRGLFPDARAAEKLRWEHPGKDSNTLPENFARAAAAMRERSSGRLRQAFVCPSASGFSPRSWNR